MTPLAVVDNRVTAHKNARGPDTSNPKYFAVDIRAIYPPPPHDRSDLEYYVIGMRAFFSPPLHTPSHPNSQWIRPLEEEGIETHPGPRYIGRNVNGLASQDRFQQCMRSVANEHKRDEVAAVFIQEHNLKPSLAVYLRLHARRHYRVLWLARYAPINGPRGKGHGTAIAIPLDSIERKPDESADQAEARVTKSLTGSKCGRVTSVTTLVGGKPTRLVSAYAPADGSKRPDFMTNILGPHLSKRTIMSVDANCVPDVVLDTQRPGSISPYDNRGANDLAIQILKYELADVARDQLGSGKLFTAHHTTQHGQVTRTRIDQMYAPNADGLLWNHATNHSFLPPRHTLAGPPDHIGLELVVNHAIGSRGKDLPRINSAIYDDPTTHHLISECLRAYYPAGAAAPSDACETWSRCKQSLRSISLARTKALRLQDTERAASLKTQINQGRATVEDGTAAPGTEEAVRRLRQELSDLTPTERTLNQTLENIAYTKGQLHDIGSAAMFRRLHSRSSDQWVNAVLAADWSDPSSPTNVAAQAISDADKIADGFVPYYESLFARKHPEPAALRKCMDALRDEGHSRVQPPTAAACGEVVTEDEVLQHCTSLPSGKSPGPDVLPNALYKTFGARLAPILAAVYNQAHARGHLPAEMTEGLISVLYKKKDRKDPRNYRPSRFLTGTIRSLCASLRRG